MKKSVIKEKKSNGKLTKASKSRAINKIRVKSAAPKRKARKKVFRKTVRSNASGTTVIGEPVIVPTEFVKNFAPVVMVPRLLPGNSVAGPYTEVVVPGERPKARIWVRVLQGDDRNGEGVVFEASPRVDLPKGTRVKYVGGTEYSPPRLSEPAVTGAKLIVALPTAPKTSVRAGTMQAAGPAM